MLGLDPGHDLDVILEPGPAQLRGEQFVDLEHAGGVVHLDLDPDRPLLAGDDPDLVDRRRRERVDVRQVRLQRHARAAVLHIERVSDSHDACLQRQRPAAAAVADDRVQDLRRDDRPLRLVVDIGEQLVEMVGGEEQAVRLVVDAVDRHPEVVQQAAAGDHHLGVRGLERIVDLERRPHAGALEQPVQAQAAVENDLQVDPRVVAHAEPLGGHLRGVPTRLQLRAGVRRGQHPGELAVALARRVDAHRGDRDRRSRALAWRGVGVRDVGHTVMKQDLPRLTCPTPTCYVPARSALGRHRSAPDGACGVARARVRRGRAGGVPAAAGGGRRVAGVGYGRRLGAGRLGADVPGSMDGAARER